MGLVLIMLLWVFSVCLHEFAHARVAYAGGDHSVAQKGYLTMNPLRYTHPLMSILLPVVFLAMGGIGLPGGAVYIETWRLRSGAWKIAVSAAGPAANILLAIIVGLIFRLAPYDDSFIWALVAFFGMLQVTAVILNLLPVPPLDGFGIIAPLLPPDTRAKAGRAGFWPLLGLFFLLFYVPQVARVFWNVIFAITNWLGIPLDLAGAGWEACRIF